MNCINRLTNITNAAASTVQNGLMSMENMQVAVRHDIPAQFNTYRWNVALYGALLHYHQR